jgi:hypothetical protein
MKAHWLLGFFIFAQCTFGDVLAQKVTVDATVEQLFTNLKLAKANNISEAIELLDPKFFEAGNYSLIFHSQSIQPSSETFPRIVLFGKNTKMLLGFNHRLGDVRSLEVLQWREVEKRWEMREISFTNGVAQISSPNPRQCVFCHGGEIVHPKLDSVELGMNGKISPAIVYGSGIKPEKWWTQFVANKNSDRVYSKLKF